jgi:hypothetical protein
LSASCAISSGGALAFPGAGLLTSTMTGTTKLNVDLYEYHPVQRLPEWRREWNDHPKADEAHHRLAPGGLQPLCG